MIRWDERRFEAYTLYSHAVKDVVSLASAVAAARGIPTTSQPAGLAQGLVALAEAETLRSSRWESVLLLGVFGPFDGARQQTAPTHPPPTRHPSPNADPPAPHRDRTADKRLVVAGRLTMSV